jgi:hypothetical protein
MPALLPFGNNIVRGHIDRITILQQGTTENYRRTNHLVVACTHMPRGHVLDLRFSLHTRPLQHAGHTLLQHSTTCCNTAQRAATQHNVLQHSKTCCNTAQPAATQHNLLSTTTESDMYSARRPLVRVLNSESRQRRTIAAPRLHDASLCCTTSSDASRIEACCGAALLRYVVRRCTGGAMLHILYLHEETSRGHAHHTTGPIAQPGTQTCSLAHTMQHATYTIVPYGPCPCQRPRGCQLGPALPSIANPSRALVQAVRCRSYPPGHRPAC